MVHTRWTEPNAAHERAVCGFIQAILSPQDNSPFLCRVARFLEKVAYSGMINGLSQALLKIACPGVPDFYQGSELWSRNLVDPDNRRPVDFPSRTQALQALLDSPDFDPAGIASDLLTKWPDGRIKLYAIWKALGCRRRHSALFREGEFIPLETAGEQSSHVLAFLRRRGEEQVVTILPRWVANIPKSVQTAELGNFWRGTILKLPPDRVPNPGAMSSRRRPSRPGLETAIHASRSVTCFRIFQLPSWFQTKQRGRRICSRRIALTRRRTALEDTSRGIVRLNASYEEGVQPRAGRSR
jgi:(1->4)-alpha-D-glucan 1-alpha-D-glucosylmutase